MTAPDATVVVAPPSIVGGANAKLTAALQQGQQDYQTLAGMLAAWPATVDPALQPVVEILQRVVGDLALLGQASAVVAKQTGLAQ
jgi:hypothetical protein